MSVRRVVVTGAGGFVGSTLARGFADRGWGVLGLDRDFGGAPVDDRVRTLRVDLEAGMPAAVSDWGPVDLLVHGAWLTSEPETLGLTRAEYRAGNLEPFRAALDFALETGIGAFVFLSSSGVFGADQGRAGPEGGEPGLHDGLRPTDPAPYAADKLEAEALTFARTEGHPVTPHVIRLGHLYGPGEVARPSRHRVSAVTRWIAGARSRHPLTVPADDPVRDWTFAPDLPEALERLVEGPPALRPVHVGSPYVHRDGEVARAIASHFPGATVVTAPAGATAKLPMIPSDVPALSDFRWTDLHTGLWRILEREAATA